MGTDEAYTSAAPDARASTRLRIAQISPLYERVPPKQYGGTERVVAHLCDALVRRGHDVTLFASGDSRTSAHLCAPIERAMRRASTDEQMAAHMLELTLAFQRSEQFDVIHSHIDFLAFPVARFSSTPSVHTLHGRLDLPYLRPIYRQFRDVPLISISDAQREPLRDLGLSWLGTVYHGLPPDEYPFGHGAGRYLAFLGRMSPEKRPDLAIQVATRVGIPIKLAAKVDQSNRAYFDRVIRPLLDGPLVEFIGEVGGPERLKFLSDALALIFPIDWPEPFGLVMIEALACGTPVVAFRRGSVPEVLVDGETGFIVDDFDDMVRAVERVSSLDRAACRRDIERRFTDERMAVAYERLYLEAVERGVRRGPPEAASS